jgi:hypothetical protein
MIPPMTSSGRQLEVLRRDAECVLYRVRESNTAEAKLALLAASAQPGAGHGRLGHVYESPAVPANPGKEDGLLLPPPLDEIETLYRLARLGNMQGIVHWTRHIEQLDACYRPFAAQLRALAEGYQSRAILELAKRYLEMKEVSGGRQTKGWIPCPLVQRVC